MLDKAILLSELIDFIKTKYLPQEKTKLGKEGKETIFFRKGGKSLCYIEIERGKPTATVVIGALSNDKVLVADISQQTKDMFKSAKQFCDGKWLVIKIETKTDINDIKTLLLIKKNPIKS